jgi:arylsulfatase A-like enzyme/Tfp pilus assembly protein PilF
MKRLLVLVGCVVLLSGLGVWFFLTGGRFGRRIRHVVLISLDTCRADYIVCYGYRRARTPNIDAVAGGGILFKNVVSPVPLTLPAHSTMMTGTIPPYHGAHDNLDYRLGDSNVTLAEILKEKGYATGAVIAAFILDSRFGLNQGFDYYSDKFDEEMNEMGIAERRGEEVTDYGIKWLDEHKDEPFFLFLHYYDPHLPYDAPAPFEPQFFKDRYSLYAAEVSYADHCIGQVIDKLKSLGIYDSTLIIIAGDHGEAIGEHSEQSHSYFIYDEVVKVPLIFKPPGKRQGRKIDDLVGLVDIAPTVCSLLGIDSLPQVQGQDLSPYFKGKDGVNKERHIYCESMTPTKYNCSSLLGAVTRRFKYIQAPRPELYDLIEDPDEIKNLAESQPQRARIMQDRLKRIVEDSVRKSGSDSQLELDDEARQKLESLGYVSGDGVKEDFEFDQTKDDPKDFIKFHSIHSRLIVHIHKEEYDMAKELCQKLLDQRPDFARGHLNMSQILQEEGDPNKARGYLEECLRLEPDNTDAHNNLGMIFFEKGRLDQAMAHFSEALKYNPDYLNAINNLGIVFLRQGEFDKAVAWWEKSLSIKSNQHKIYCNLALAMNKQDKPDEASQYYLKSLELEPDQPDLLNDLGFIFEQKNDVDQAVVYYSESLRLDPNQPNVHNTLGRLLTLHGQLDQAINHYTESLKLKPDEAVIQNNIAEIYFKQGKNKQALVYWDEVLKIRPDMVTALNNVAWLKAVHEKEPFYNPNEAVRLAQQAAELTEHKKPSLLDTLSVAYAAAGRFDDAIATAQEAIELAQSLEQEELAEEIKKHLELYKAGQPYLVE